MFKTVTAEKGTKLRTDLEETIGSFISELIDSIDPHKFKAWRSISEATLTGPAMCEAISKYVYETLKISVNVMTIQKIESLTTDELMFGLMIDLSQNQVDNYDKKTGQHLLDLLDEVQKMQERLPEKPPKRPQATVSRSSAVSTAAVSVMCSAVSCISSLDDDWDDNMMSTGAMMFDVKATW